MMAFTMEVCICLEMASSPSKLSRMASDKLPDDLQFINPMLHLGVIMSAGVWIDVEWCNYPMNGWGEILMLRSSSYGSYETVCQDNVEFMNVVLSGHMFDLTGWCFV